MNNFWEVQSYYVCQTNNQPQFLIPNSLQLSLFPPSTSTKYIPRLRFIFIWNFNVFYTFAPSYKQLHNE